MRNRMFMFGGIAALVIALAVFASGFALSGMHAQEGRGERHARGHFPGPEMVDQMARVLDLTDAQQTQIKTILEGARAASDSLHNKMDEVRKQLEDATANGQFDEAQVRALANQQAQLMADSIVEHERTKSKVFAVMTAEQRAKAIEFHKRGLHRRHGGPHSR